VRTYFFENQKVECSCYTESFQLKILLSQTSFILVKPSFMLVKNDPMGTGPASNRTHRVPCSCLSALPKKQRALLVLSLRASPLEQSPCASNCPFSVMNTYLNNIPDPFGSGLEIGIASGKFAQGRLKFMRALSTRGNRVFTEQPLGKLNNLLVTFY